MGLGPDVWGPHGWKFLHFVALGYPKKPTNEDKINYKTFFMLIPTILPCSICSNHYIENLKQYPITDDILEDKIKLFNWTVNMHNKVNILNGKQTVDYDTALKLLINNFTDANIKNHQIMHAQVDNKIHAQVDNKIHAQVDNKMHAQVDNKIHAQVDNKMHAQVDNKIHATNDFMNYIILFFILVFIIIYLYYMKNKKI